MSPISSITGGQNNALLNLQKLQASAGMGGLGDIQKMASDSIRATQGTSDPGSIFEGSSTQKSSSSDSFATLLNDLVDSVDSKSKAADQQAQDVMLGNSDNLHQAMISMQEASVSFSLMVEVRNKLVDSYKELSQMQV